MYDEKSSNGEQHVIFKNSVYQLGKYDTCNNTIVLKMNGQGTVRQDE